jgi:cation:H+ antiporter
VELGSVGRLAAGLAAVLASAVLFTNAVEWAGRRLGLSHGAVGSVFAAVGTALPETIVAVLAILLGARAGGEAVGIGAILGAPLLLATVAFWVTGAAALALERRVLRVQASTLQADLGFFLVVYALAALAGVVRSHPVKLALAAVLVAAYGWYAVRTLLGRRAEAREGRPRPLWLSPRGARPAGWLVALQLALGLGGMVAAAQLFVGGLVGLSLSLGVSGFVLSVIVTPLATELPETINSVIWLRQGKDTLAMANITGAMALQSSLIPALGILATPWTLGRSQLLAVGLALASALGVWWASRARGRLSALHLVASGLFYVVYVALVL